jgi:hypothetical protein
MPDPTCAPTAFSRAAERRERAVAQRTRRRGSSGVHSVSCLVDARALRSTNRLSGTFRTERSAPSSLVAVRERRLTELLRRP